MDDRSAAVRKIIVTSTEFKAFWKKSGGYPFALTSREFPPVLLEAEEWIFAEDAVALLKELMQFAHQKMKVIRAPFNRKNKSILRPENLSQWKINHFPEQWDCAECDLFTPDGQLTKTVLEPLDDSKEEVTAKQVEDAFFKCLEARLDEMGYLLFRPDKASGKAGIQAYLEEWEQDEKDAGLV